MIESNLKPGQTLRYARYARASTDPHRASAAEQFQQIEEAIQRQGHINWLHVADYHDHAPGDQSLAQCPALKRLIEDIDSGALTVNVIIAASPDRFSRTAAMQCILETLRKHHGVRVITTDGGLTGFTCASQEMSPSR